MRRLGIVAVAAAFGIAAGVALAPRLEAAKTAPQLDVTFGPVVVEARSSAQAFLAVRNFGTAAAALSLGDAFDVRYGAGAGTSDLAFTGSSLVASGLPGTMRADPLPGAAGVSIFVQADQSIQPGETLLVPFAFAAGEAGVAPVSVAVKAKKTAGKFPRTVEARVVKTAPRSDLFFGDGHDGALVVSSDLELPNGGSFSFSSVTVEAGKTLTVPSGALIRCAGPFTNAGTIVVRPGTPGGTVRLDATYDAMAMGFVFDPAKQRTAPVVPTDRADALSVPSFPALMDDGQASTGALGGAGLGSRARRLPLSWFRTGGGGGTGQLGAAGGDGGGLLRVLALGDVTNSGTIRASGTAGTFNRGGYAGGGTGGGGGGIVLLLSAARVVNSGAVDVRGGNAGPPDGYGGGGGPGGGGLAVFVAPQVERSGTVLTAAGGDFLNAGATVAALRGAGSFLPVWSGGGGGGACVGDGGDGHGVASDGAVDTLRDAGGALIVPRPAQDGDTFDVLADPRAVW